MTTYILITLIAGFLCIIGILDYRTRRLQREQSINKAHIVGVYECIEKIQEYISEQNRVNLKSLETTKSLIEQTNNTSETLRRVLLAIHVFKLGSQMCIAKTVSKVISDPNMPTPRETSVALLDNIKIEYINVVAQLKEQLLQEDSLEKEKILKMIQEYDNTIAVISTISEESTDDYLEQIYREVLVSMKKVREMGN